MMLEHEELEKKLEEEELSTEEVRTLKRTVRSLDIRIGKSSKTEERLTHDIMLARNKQCEHSACRILPLGEDRLFRRYWWMDMHLIKPSARNHATGIILVEAPPATAGMEGEHGCSALWSFYDREEELDRLIAFLNPLGCREAHLGALLTQHREAIARSLSPFPLAEAEQRKEGEETAPATTAAGRARGEEGKEEEGEEGDDGEDEEEEMPVVMRRRAARRRVVPLVELEPVAEFLRYRNAFRSSAPGRKTAYSR